MKKKFYEISHIISFLNKCRNISTIDSSKINKVPEITTTTKSPNLKNLVYLLEDGGITNLVNFLYSNIVTNIE